MELDIQFHFDCIIIFKYYFDSLGIGVEEEFSTVQYRSPKSSLHPTDGAEWEHDAIEIQVSQLSDTQERLCAARTYHAPIAERERHARQRSRRQHPVRV